VSEAHLSGVERPASSFAALAAHKVRCQRSSRRNAHGRIDTPPPPNPSEPRNARCKTPLSRVEYTYTQDFRTSSLQPSLPSLSPFLICSRSRAKDSGSKMRIRVEGSAKPLRMAKHLRAATEKADSVQRPSRHASAQHAPRDNRTSHELRRQEALTMSTDKDSACPWSNCPMPAGRKIAASTTRRR
jgi:hypothetical protein